MNHNIDPDIVHNWLNNLLDCWQRKDIDAAVSIFKKCNLYQESPFKQCANSLEEIKNFWTEIQSQKDINVSFKILSISGRTVTVNYEAHFINNGQKHHSNGIYFISFDKNMYCTSFRQWFMVNSC